MNTKMNTNTNINTDMHANFAGNRKMLDIKNLSPGALKDKIREFHESDVAEALEMLDYESRRKVFQVLDGQELADILEYASDVEVYLSELTLKKKVEVLSALDSNRAGEYLRALGKEERNTIIELMDEETRKDISLVLSFEEDEIGRVMTTNYIEILPNLTVREAMRELISQAADNDNVSTIYVVDGQSVFYGAIDLKDLIVARETDSLASIITTGYPYVYARELIEGVIPKMKRYSEDSIPVLNEENRLPGVVTAPDFAELMEEELGEDYAKLAGLSSSEDLKESLSESMKKRLPWLVILLGMGVVVSSVVGMFESVAATLTIIVCFQSLVLDMAGNVGTQSLAVTIRVLMDESLTGSQKLKLVWKEGKVGLVNGLVLGTLAFLVIGGYIYLLKGKSLGFAFAVSGCTGGALMISMLLAALAGTVIPIFFKKIKVDPTVASGPLITTVNDLVAVISYYGLTWLFLLNLLQLTE